MTMTMELPPKVANQLAQLQQLQQQLQLVVAQRQQISAQADEVEFTLKELGKLKEKKASTVYRSTGAVLIKVQDVKALVAELEESKETLGVKNGSLEKQEKHFRERAQSLQQQLTEAVQGLGMGPSG